MLGRHKQFDSTGTSVNLHKNRSKFKGDSQMTEAYSQITPKWECKYHIVWVPKYRKKTIYKELRQQLDQY